MFSEREEGDKSHLSIAEIDGGFTRRLTFGDHNDVWPNWSRDGRWIYLSSDRTGERQIWKIAAEEGEAIQLTRGGGLRPRESGDGRFVYYADRPGPCNIRRVPVNGGAELPVMVGRTTQSGLWTLWRNQIVHADYGNPTVGVDVFDLDSNLEKGVDPNWGRDSSLIPRAAVRRLGARGPSPTEDPSRIPATF